MNENNNNNAENQFVKTSSVGTVSEALWEFLDPESKSNLISLCRYTREKVTNNVKDGRTKYEKQ